MKKVTRFFSRLTPKKQKKFIKFFRRWAYGLVLSPRHTRRLLVDKLLLLLIATFITLALTYGFPLLYYLKNTEHIQATTKAKTEMAISQVKPQPKKEKKRKLKMVRKTVPRSKSSRSEAKFDLKLGGSSSGVGLESQDLKNIVFKEGEVDKPARALASVPATYPPLAQEAGVSGEVELQIVIDEYGQVSKAEVAKEDPSGYGFKEACLEVIYQFKFRPAMKDNIPVKMEYIYPFSF